MSYLFVFSILLVTLSLNCGGSDIFHEKSKITFYPDSFAEYFGYTVVLTNSSLIIGAPKARSRFKSSTSPGMVFTCPLTNLDIRNVTCYPLGIDANMREISIERGVTDFFRDDMWFGATIATISNDRLLVCAPRWQESFKNRHFLASGACYVETKKNGISLTPLKDQARLAFKSDGQRKEYSETGINLNFYAYGQAGISAKVTDINSLIIGAPGLLQWTGGIVDYRFSPRPNDIFFGKQAVHNPYFTKDLGPDDYFGYSVESGIFQVNGSTLYVAGAPRSKMGYGQVLVFDPDIREFLPLNVKAKVRGPQLGSYFGASLRCTDLDGDGRSDLLVGAPNFIRKNDGLPYDQGAVFIYLAKEQKSGFVLEEAGSVSGSDNSGARFGSSIADLGDTDGDGFRDVAIGAPWENEGMGVVYIYRGSAKGLHTQYTQRIIAERALSFGISISNGIDVDGNNCNDLAVGAHNSDTAYVFRCIPTMQVQAVIKVPDAMNLPQNATKFTAIFCVTVPPKKYWAHVKIDLRAKITIDVEARRAMISGDPEFTISAKPGEDICHEQTVDVKPTADLSKPIAITFELEPIKKAEEDSQKFVKHAARLSEDSILHSEFLIQLVRDCGDDLVCTPWLEMTLESFKSVYVPGTQDRLGAILTVFNKEEPAYGAKVHLTLPLPPKRVPGECSLEGMNMTCEIPGPLPRGESVQWEIELEYTSNVIKGSDDKALKIKAVLEDVLYRRNVSEDTDKEVVILVTPVANFSISGKSLPNTTVVVTREKFHEEGNVSFVHYFEVINFGPSDWAPLDAVIEIPENVSLAGPLPGCVEYEYHINCSWPMPAHVSLHVSVPLRYDLQKFGKFLEEQTSYNASTVMTLLQGKHKNLAVISTVLLLDPAPPLWPVLIGSVAGLLVLSAIIYGLYKHDFFSRKRRDQLKRLQEESSPHADDVSDCARGSRRPSTVANESTAELLSDTEDSD